tara:strand:- start:261 stop:1046 length:786 start_codon:yes stop_codon:yes gene_type:complete
MEDIRKYTPLRHYYVKVDMDAAEQIETKSGFKLFAPPEEGDTYQSKPFHGVLINAPKNSKIPMGEIVYLNYKAIDSLHTQGKENFYMVTEDLIIAYGDKDNIKAYKSVLVDPIDKKPESDFILLPDYLFKDLETTSGVVIDADNEWLKTEKSRCNTTFKKGDVIQYAKNIDWEYMINRKKNYYIQFVWNIFSKNGKLVNDYNKLIPNEEWVERNGLKLPNTERYMKVEKGKFKGKRILPQVNRIEQDTYIKNEFIFGHLDE